MIRRIYIFVALGGLMCGMASAQPPATPPPGSLPPAGAPGNLPPGNPPMGNPPIMNPGPGPATPPPPPPGWGAPGYLLNPPTADWMNSGTLNVMATGYDSEGVMQQLPLYISYSFNGVNYNITVLNSWNPYTQSWNIGVDIPAYQTTYYLNGFTYNYYAVLPTGTFYFNL